MKIVVNFNQKQPMEGVEFASVGAGVNIEENIGEGKSDDEVKTFARHLYGLARQIVEVELGQPQAASPSSHCNNGNNGFDGAVNGNGNAKGNGNGRNGNGNGRPASEKQRQFIVSLVAQKNGNGGLRALESRFGKPISELTKKEASDLITELKGKEA